MSDASFLQKLGWRAEALGWDAYEGFFRMQGLDKASDSGAALLRFLGPKSPTHKIARINMQRCLPEAAPEEIERLLGQMWDNIGRLAAEMPNLHVFNGEEFDDRVEFVGRERLEAARDEGRAMVIIALHQANWEVTAAAITRTGLPCHITYRAANNPYIDKRITEAREAYGVKLLTAKGGDGAKQLMKALKSGWSVALMNDQKMNDGVEAPFFGHPAMTAPGPTRLAMREGLDLQPMSIRRLEGARFRVEACEPIKVSENPDKAAAIVETVAKINQWAEAEIRRAPAQWFWVHRRWAKSVYKDGA
jgi:KDO2-lipid IV(A) lauroyltransferase